jgi:transposase
MEFIECNKVKLVMDRGFYREKNINGLLCEHLKFLIGAKTSLKFVQGEIDKVRNTIRQWQYYLPEADVFGLTTPIQWNYKRNRPYKKDEVHEERRMYLHIYFDPVRAADEEKKLYKLLSSLKDELETNKLKKSHESLCNKYFDTKTTPIRGLKVTAKEDVLITAKKDFGFFVLLSNEATNASQALTTYRNKDVVEKAFDNIKDRLDMKRLNVSSDLSLNGKLFVEFIALIFISYLHKSMLDNNLYKKFTMHELLDEIEMIERFDREGYKPQYSEITDKQMKIYEAFKFAPPNAKAI